MTNLMAHLKLKKKRGCFTQIGSQILRWVSFRDSWMHRLSQMPRGEEVIKHAWLSCCVRRRACWIYTPMYNELYHHPQAFLPVRHGEWGYIHVEARGRPNIPTMLLPDAPHSRNAVLLPQHLLGAHLPKRLDRNGCPTSQTGLSWPLYELQMSILIFFLQDFFLPSVWLLRC